MSCCGFSAALAGAVITLVLLAVLHVLIGRRRTLNIDGAHSLITGGSSGIGLAVAEELLKRGSSVTIVARNQERLNEAKQKLEKCVTLKPKQKVLALSCDISGSYTDVERIVKQAEAECGPINMLINSAGTSYSGKFEEIPVEVFSNLMKVNYLGSVYVTRAVIGGMKLRGRGCVVFVSSQAGQTGLYGFSGYSATKFALRGLAESLQMEVKPYNIHVCISFPPDTDTPGFEEEQKTKPEETRLISESSGLFSADTVAKALVNDALSGRYASHVGLDGALLSIITCGMSPVTSLAETLLQAVVMGPMRLISVFFLYKFDSIVNRCHKQREKSK